MTVFKIVIWGGKSLDIRSKIRNRKCDFRTYISPQMKILNDYGYTGSNALITFFFKKPSENVV